MKALKEIQTIYHQSGVKSLNDKDLLHLLGVNLEECNFLELFNSTHESLLRKGVTPGAALKIRALSEVAHRYSTTPIQELPSISSSSSAAKIISPFLKHLPHEECWVLYLNRGNKLISKERLSVGGVTATVVDIKLIMKRALELLACSIILVHNHPSGNNKPGENDRTQTKLLKDAANFFDINLLDHLIIAGDSFFSFADDGII
jgi:DNA repair protein RadC